MSTEMILNVSARVDADGRSTEDIAEGRTGEDVVDRTVDFRIVVQV